MPLKMRPTGLGHGVYKDNVDYSIFCGEWCIGRIYKTRTGPEHLRWFWALHFPSGRTCAPTNARGHWKRRRRNSRSAGASGRRGPSWKRCPSFRPWLINPSSGW